MDEQLIPFYVCMCVFVCLCVLHLFIHSSVGHLGCFHILAIVNNANKLRSIYLFELVYFFFRYTPRSGISWVIWQFFLFIFQKLSYCFPSGCTLHFHQQRTSFPSPLFILSLPMFVICALFDDSHSDRCKAMPHCDFDLHFPDDQRC